MKHTRQRPAMIGPYSCSFIHSFIHIKHLYSAPSRKLLRGAPDSSTAKKSSFKVRKEHRRESPRKEAKLQREAIPGRGTHHRVIIYLLKYLRHLSWAQRVFKR